MRRKHHDLPLDQLPRARGLQAPASDCDHATDARCPRQRQSALTAANSAIAYLRRLAPPGWACVPLPRTASPFYQRIVRSGPNICGSGQRRCLGIPSQQADHQDRDRLGNPDNHLAHYQPSCPFAWDHPSPSAQRGRRSASTAVQKPCEEISRKNRTAGRLA